MAVSKLPWMVEAEKWVGVHERRGYKRLYASIKQWLQDRFDPRTTPWCGAFVALVIRGSLPKEKIPENPWGARNWLEFGKKCPLQEGAIAVFWRGRRSGWSGHVGFVDAIDRKRGLIRVLGGNQSDAVTYAWLSTDRLLECRWPSTYKDGSGVVKDASASGAKVSTNEE